MFIVQPVVLLAPHLLSPFLVHLHLLLSESETETVYLHHRYITMKIIGINYYMLQKRDHRSNCFWTGPAYMINSKLSKNYIYIHTHML